MRLRGVLTLMVLAALCVGVPTASAGKVVLDTLNGAKPPTTFNALGAGFWRVDHDSLVGPRFRLRAATVITQIGGYVNAFQFDGAGHIDHPAEGPMRVEIRREVKGLPNPSRYIARFSLGIDEDPLIYRYRAAKTNLLLRAGYYFALFSAARRDDTGGLLANSLLADGSHYFPGVPPLGLGRLDLGEGIAAVDSVPAAVRIVGVRAP